MTLGDDLSKLWRKYEKSWGFEIPLGIREKYENRCLGETTEEDLEADLQAMTLMVIHAYTKGKSTSSHKKVGQPTSRYPSTFFKRLNRALTVANTFIDLEQDPRSNRHSWKPVADKLNASNPSEHWTADELRKAWHHDMSDIAVEGSVNALLPQLVKREPLGNESTVDFSKGGTKS